MTWKVYSQPVVTFPDLAEEGRSGMFLFDCCPIGWLMSKTVRGVTDTNSKNQMVQITHFPHLHAATRLTVATLSPCLRVLPETSFGTAPSKARFSGGPITLTTLLLECWNLKDHSSTKVDISPWIRQITLQSCPNMLYHQYWGPNDITQSYNHMHHHNINMSQICYIPQAKARTIKPNIFYTNQSLSLYF